MTTEEITLDIFKQMIADLDTLAQKYADIFIPLNTKHFEEIKASGNLPPNAKPSTRDDVLHDIYTDLIYHSADRRKEIDPDTTDILK